MAMKLLATVLLFLTIYPATLQSHWLPHRPPPLPQPLPHPENPKPLCISQLALVNRACAFLSYTRVTPPSPPSPEEGDGEKEGGSGNHHHHQNSRRREGYVETPQEEECCRWVKQVDPVCVCDLLVIVHLPAFMTRLVHEYKVVVNESCEVSFECSSRLVKL